jgi:hypothetical protein
MENWKIGNYKSCVVSDTKVKNTNFPSPPNPEESRDEDIEFYGGYLICESIGNNQHAKLIAAAPDLLVSSNTLIQAIKMRTSIGHDLIHEIIQVENAIKKAIG